MIGSSRNLNEMSGPGSLKMRVVSYVRKSC